MDSAARPSLDLTVLVITKNESRNIAGCLQSVEWVPRRLVIDAESTDDTVHEAQAQGAEVFVRPWPGYGPQKNFGLDQARSEWVLIVDADERITPALETEIRRTLAPPVAVDVAGFEIPRRNHFYGRCIQHGGMYPDYQLRLIRRTLCRYDDTRLHERLVAQGRVVRLAEPMDHLTMPTIGHHAKKIALYSTLGAEEKLKRQARVTAGAIAGNHVGTILKTYVLRGAIRDGVHGLIVSIFAGMFTFLKYAKAWEAQVPPVVEPTERGGGRAARH